MLLTRIYFYNCNDFLVTHIHCILIHIPVFIVICIAFHPTYRMLRIACILGGATVVTLNTRNKTLNLGLLPSFIHNRPFPLLPSHLTSRHHPCITPVVTSHRPFLYFRLPHLAISLTQPITFFLYLFSNSCVLICQLNLCIYVCKIISNNQSVDQYVNSTSSISGSVFSAR